MTPTQVAALLAKVAAYDHRTVTDGDVLAWHEALGDLALTECLEAVAGHYRDSRDWLMPAQVRQRVKAAREARALTRHHEAVRAELECAQPYPVAEGVQMLAKALDVSLRPPRRVRSAACPWCKASPHDPCVIPGVFDSHGRPVPMSKVHPSRLEAVS